MSKKVRLLFVFEVGMNFRQALKKNQPHNTLEFICGQNGNMNALRECFMYVLSAIHICICFI